MIKVSFFQVKDNGTKIKVICNKAQESFALEKRLLIAAPNTEAANYVESLLWKLPEESFMPHVIAEAETAEWIAITTQDKINVNKAPRLLNLCPVPSLLYQFVDEVYDFFDETNPQKLELSQKRMEFYQSQGFLIKKE